MSLSSLIKVQTDGTIRVGGLHLTDTDGSLFADIATGTLKAAETVVPAALGATVVGKAIEQPKLNDVSAQLTTKTPTPTTAAPTQDDASNRATEPAPQEASVSSPSVATIAIGVVVALLLFRS